MLAGGRRVTGTGCGQEGVRRGTGWGILWGPGWGPLTAPYRPTDPAPPGEPSGISPAGTVLGTRGQTQLGEPLGAPGFTTVTACPVTEMWEG